MEKKLIKIFPKETVNKLIIDKNERDQLLQEEKSRGVTDVPKVLGIKSSTLKKIFKKSNSSAQ